MKWDQNNAPNSSDNWKRVLLWRRENSSKRKLIHFFSSWRERKISLRSQTKSSTRIVCKLSQWLSGFFVKNTWCHLTWFRYNPHAQNGFLFLLIASSTWKCLVYMEIKGLFSMEKKGKIYVKLIFYKIHIKKMWITNLVANQKRKSFLKCLNAKLKWLAKLCAWILLSFFCAFWII